MENFNNINELSLKQLKIKYNKFVNNESKELIKNKIKNQQNMCYICCGELDIHNDNNLVVKTKCNHFFHYECLKISHMNKVNLGYNYAFKKECPYCRTNTGWLPLIDKIPIKNIHKEYYNLKKKLNKPICQAILKSGKKKGQICGCIIKKMTENKCCGRHKNYVFPILDEEEIKNEEKEKNVFLKNWFVGKILNCY